ncbi:MAG: hypothetical protein RBT69_12745 [Spirochaetia bacterium]|jgi:hypothetical protein|nr:hypothetical protein [Spirochaetia bacterium]
MDFRYHPYYCEENIYLLCADFFREKDDTGAHVLLITNSFGGCSFACQKIAHEGRIVLWDYHVVLHTDSLIYDFDSTLPFPCPADQYLCNTFLPETSFIYQPLFNAVPARTYLDKFSSDRRHMKNPDGNWKKPPPPWPLISGWSAESTHELPRFLDCKAESFGCIISLKDLKHCQ